MKPASPSHASWSSTLSGLSISQSISIGPSSPARNDDVAEDEVAARLQHAGDAREQLSLCRAVEVMHGEDRDDEVERP